MLDEHLGLGLSELGFGLIELGLGNEILGAESASALGVEADEIEVSCGVGQLGFGRAEARFVGRRVEFGENLALFHRRVIVHINFDDEPGDLGGNINASNRFEAARGGDDLLDVAARNFGTVKLGGLFTAAAEVKPGAGADGA